MTSLILIQQSELADSEILFELSGILQRMRLSPRLGCHGDGGNRRCDVSGGDSACDAGIQRDVRHSLTGVTQRLSGF